jgi:hypothetical protein
MAFSQLGTGLLCVDEDVIEIFDAINKIRTDLTTSPVYINLLDDITAWSASQDYWLYDNAPDGQYLADGEASLTGARDAVLAVGSALPAFTWSEGIALACEANAADYKIVQSHIGVPIDSSSTS